MKKTGFRTVIDKKTGAEIEGHYNRVSVKTTYNPDRKRKVDNSYVKALDINNIVNTYKITGQIPPGLQRPGTYMDKTAGNTLAEYMLFKENTMDLFRQLPKKIRDQFGDDPATFLATLSRVKPAGPSANNSTSGNNAANSSGGNTASADPALPKP